MVISPIRILNMGYKATNAKDLQQRDRYLYVANFCYRKNLYFNIANEWGWQRRRIETNEIRSGDVSVFWHKHDIPHLKWIITLERIIGTHAKREWNRISFMQAPNAFKGVRNKVVLLPHPCWLAIRQKYSHHNFKWMLTIPTRCKSSMISNNYVSLKCANVDQQRRS